MKEAKDKIDQLYLQQVANTLRYCFTAGNKLLTFGVGGNAATAIHLAAEMSGKYEKSVEPLPCVCLSENPSIITAITNDFGWPVVFERQIRALAKKGDMVISFSISGEADYLKLAFQAAREIGCINVLFNGRNTLSWIDDLDLLIALGIEDTPRVQEWQLRVVHDLCAMVKK